jgi:hypothetical protein
MSKDITVSAVSNVLRRMFSKYSYLVAADVATAAGMREDEFSKVRNGHKDIHSVQMLRIVNALPEEPKLYFLLNIGALAYRDAPCDPSLLSILLTSSPVLDDAIEDRMCLN